MPSSPCVAGPGVKDPEIYCVLREAAARNNGTVVLTATDSSAEFSELLDNWACSVHRAGLVPTVWALDEQMYRQQQQRQRRFRLSVVYSPSIQLPQRAHPNQYKRPAGEEYTIAVSLKPLVMLTVLSLGFDFLFVDVDVALLRDPLPWLARRRGIADLQVSLNYDDHPDAVRLSQHGTPDLNTGVVFARSNPRTRSVASRWSERAAARYRCPARPPLWACGDQEQLTRLLKECGYRSPSFEVAAQLVENWPQTLHGSLCTDRMTSTAESRTPTMQWSAGLTVDVLPPRFFSSGRSSKLWRMDSMSTRGMVPQSVLTFHPNFLGNAGGLKKAKLQSLRLAPEAKRFVESDRRERGMDVGFMAARAREKWLPTPRFPARSSAW